MAFYPYSKNFNNDSFDYEALAQTDYVYMRWKEHFLVPDHTIKDITGASFAGFYYICFQKSTSQVEGYYFHRNSEWSACVLTREEFDFDFDRPGRPIYDFNSTHFAV